MLFTDKRIGVILCVYTYVSMSVHVEGEKIERGAGKEGERDLNSILTA